MTPTRTCPGCGAPLVAKTPLNHCPRCLLQLAFATEELPTQGSRERPPTGDSNVTKPQNDLEDLHRNTNSQAHASPLTPESLAPLFPQLEILEPIGRGGMGIVFRARHRQLDRLVALKILASELAEDPAFAERFRREARSLARLSHPHIVTVHDFGATEGLYYLIMEHVEGGTLRDRLLEGTLEASEALSWIPQICEALGYAHERGIVHRDIKPENILLDAAGKVKLADFGLSKLLRPTPGEPSLTSTRLTLGTPDYMAPEQIERPEAVDHRADLYALGVVFYEMLTGELPRGHFAPPSQKSNLDPALDEVVLKALAREPEGRFQTAGEFKQGIERIVSRGSLEENAEPSESARSLGLFEHLSFWTILAASLWTVLVPLEHLAWIQNPSGSPDMATETARSAAYALAALLSILGALWIVVLFRQHRITSGPDLAGSLLKAIPMGLAAIYLLWMTGWLIPWLWGWDNGLPLSWTGLFWGPLLLMPILWWGVRRQAGLLVLGENWLPVTSLPLLAIGSYLAAHRALPAALFQLVGVALIVIAISRTVTRARRDGEREPSLRALLIPVFCLLAGGALSLQFSPDRSFGIKALLILAAMILLMPSIFFLAKAAIGGLRRSSASIASESGSDLTNVGGTSVLKEMGGGGDLKDVGGGDDWKDVGEGAVWVKETTAAGAGFGLGTSPSAWTNRSFWRSPFRPEVICYWPVILIGIAFAASHLPPLPSPSLQSTLSAHRGSATRLAADSTGRLIARMAGPGRLQLVDFYGEPVDEITGVLPILALGGRVNLEGLEDHLQDDSDPRTQLIQVSRDGKVLAGGRDTLLIWDGETGKLVREIPLEILEPTGRTVEGTVKGTAENTASITVLTLDGAGRTVALGLSTGEIQIYEVDTGTLVTHIAPSRVPGSAPASALTFSRDGPDGRHLAAGFEDGTVCLFETRPGITAARRIEKQTGSQSEKRSLESTRIQLRSYRVTGPVRDLDFSPDGERLLIASREVLLWLVGERFLESLGENLTGGRGRDLARSPDSSGDANRGRNPGESLVEDSGGNPVRTLEADEPPRALNLGPLSGHTLRILERLALPSKPIRTARFSPSGDLIVASRGSTILVWREPFDAAPEPLIGSQSSPAHLGCWSLPILLKSGFSRNFTYTTKMRG